MREIKEQLLAWAGLHRGKGISEEVMPRFHEIIGQFDTLVAQRPDLTPSEHARLVKQLRYEGNFLIGCADELENQVLDRKQTIAVLEFLSLSLQRELEKLKGIYE